MALESIKKYYTPDEELSPPNANQQFELEWSDPKTLAAIGEGENGLSALETTANAFVARKMDVPYALRMAIQDKTPIDPRATMAGIESGVLPPADKLPPVTPYPVSKTVTFPRALEQAASKQGLIGDLRSPVAMPEGVPSLSMPSGVPAKTTDFASLQKLMSPGGLKAPEASPIPIRTAPSGSDATSAVASTLPATTEKQPAGKPDSSGKDGMPSPSSSGAGGDVDAENRLFQGQLLARMAAGLGNVAAGRSTDIGVADMLGERLKQVQALRAKREERQEGLALERSQNEQTLNAYQAQFPELRETLEPLRGQTGKPVFPSLLRDVVAARKAKTGERALDLREQGMKDTAAYRAGTLGLRKDTLEENKRYNAVQAGLKQADLDLRAAENARKAAGGTEPTEDERNKYMRAMQPAEKTAVSLRDADSLNTLSDGMLITGKPPEFLSRSDIAAFNGFPLGETSRSMLAQSNPQAYDLLTKMAELKTMVGHEYFGSALSPSEAERQRQFLDFGMMDSPESIARKMKSYHDTLANKASVFLRPRVVGRPLGAEWAQTSGLDVISAPGGTFAGLLDAPKGATAKAPAAPAPAAPAQVVKKTPSARSIEALKKNPDDMTRQQFDEAFGPGSAAKALGE